MKTLCVTIPQPRQAELQEIEIPDPTDNDVLVQTHVSLISTGTESFIYRGEFDPDSAWGQYIKYPKYPGYSNVGRIIKAGKNVTRLQEGDRVYCGASHRQYAVLPDDPRRIFKLHDDDQDEDAAWSALSYITQTAVRHAHHLLGDTAAVIGLGPLGQLVTQYLRVSGLREIIAIDHVQSRLDRALAHGATHAFKGSAADAHDFVKSACGGELPDVVYDVTGHFAVLPLALKLVRTQGSLILLGDCPTPSKQHITSDVLARQIRIQGTLNDGVDKLNAGWIGPRQAQLFLQYVRRQQMRVSDLITHRFRPDQAPNVYDFLLHDRSESLGVLFDWR